MVEQVALNWWAVLTAVPITLALGALWYSPSAFGKIWLKKIGKRQEDFLGAKGMILGYGSATVGAFLTAWVFGTVLAFASTENAVEGMLGAFFMWLGFIFAVFATNDFMERRPGALFWINVSYWLVDFLAIGALLGGWH